MKQDLIPLHYTTHGAGEHCMFWKCQPDMMRKYKGFHTVAYMTVAKEVKRGIGPFCLSVNVSCKGIRS
jgi:hypothetical protein